MDEAARIVVMLFAAWLITVGLLMAVNPKLALRGLSKMASTNLINYTEITLRLIAGLALWRFAAQSDYPDILRAAGIFIAVTSGMLYLTPREWHAGYARWWATKLPPMLVRPCWRRCRS